MTRSADRRRAIPAALDGGVVFMPAATSKKRDAPAAADRPMRASGAMPLLSAGTDPRPWYQAIALAAHRALRVMVRGDLG